VVERSGLWTVAAVGAFVAASSLHLLLGRILRYAVLELRPKALLALPIVLLAALLHDRIFRGSLYAELGRRLPAGFAAPVAAALAAIVPVTLRFYLLPEGRAPLPILLTHAVLVEWMLGVALCWLVLGTGTWIASGAALGCLWSVRLAVVPTFHGATVPLLELLAAAAAAASVAAVLWSRLSVHRDAVMEMPS
jgi:hypothetical protein